MQKEDKKHPAIAHLTNDEIDIIYEQYINPDNKVADLIETYKLNVQKNQFFNIFPPVELKDTLCPYCHIPMYEERKKKTKQYETIYPECYNCRHINFPVDYSGYDKCRCKTCYNIRIEKLKAEKIRIRFLISKNFSLDFITPLHYDDLSFFHKTILLTLFKVCSDEQLKCIYSLSRFYVAYPKKRITPTNKMDDMCIEELHKKKIIIVDPKSPIETFNKESNYTEAYIERVNFLPNITFDGLKRSNFKDVFTKIEEDLSKCVLPEWKDSIHETLYRIAIEECLQYIHIKIAESNSIKFIAENKTKKIISSLLKKFSVSNLYYLIKKATDDAIVFYDKKQATNKTHAGNIIPQRIEYWSNKFIYEGWKIFAYHRDRRAPQSEISKVLFDNILKEEDAGFYKASGIHWDELVDKHFS